MNYKIDDILALPKDALTALGITIKDTNGVDVLSFMDGEYPTELHATQLCEMLIGRVAARFISCNTMTDGNSTCWLRHGPDHGRSHSMGMGPSLLAAVFDAFSRTLSEPAKVEGGDLWTG